MKNTFIRIYLSLFFFCFIINAAFSSINISEGWDDNFRPIVQINCTKDNNACSMICGYRKSCQISNRICENCISTSPKMMLLFKYLGSEITQDEEVTLYEFINFIKTNSFIALGPRSIYNQFDDAKSEDFLNRMKSLCPEDTLNPILFVTSSKELEIKNIKYVSCEGSVYSVRKYYGDSDEN